MNFKQAVEIGMESIVDFELYNNAWDKKVKKRVCRDFVENNIGAVRLGFDKNNKIYLRYADAPVDLYTSYTDEPDYNVPMIVLLGRRDDFVDSDWFIVSIDPYYDRRSGFEFAVNPKGSIADWTIYNDETVEDVTITEDFNNINAIVIDHDYILFSIVYHIIIQEL